MSPDSCHHRFIGTPYSEGSLQTRTRRPKGAHRNRTAGRGASLDACSALRVNSSATHLSEGPKSGMSEAVAEKLAAVAAVAAVASVAAVAAGSARSAA